MGLKGKILMLLLVYIAGFMSAIYYVAPQDGLWQGNDKAGRIVDGITYCKQRACEKMSQVDKGDFKNLYDKSLAAVEDMKTKYNASKQQQEQQLAYEPQQYESQ